MDDARIRGTLTPDEAYSVAVNWDPGWSAKVNGRPIPVVKDGLGLMAIVPHCSGPCEVELHWSAAPESWLVTLAFLITMAACGRWIWRERRASSDD